ncbi:unnamed protein product [Pseudo-nitzschia multistriata]|uniref:EF-hand domain-containing protein n=1 Tax=Pseudo-nitzschia multistriata TaxID=183589 RepID=A0A448ZMV4_9STRA|nr:unnamed protein product [Pseudo-nitzschia multistriata]
MRTDRRAIRNAHSETNGRIELRVLWRHGSLSSLCTMMRHGRKEREAIKRLVRRTLVLSFCLGGRLIGSADTAFAYVPRNHRTSMRRGRTIRRDNPAYALTTVSSSKIAPDRTIPTNSTYNNYNDTSLKDNYPYDDTINEHRPHTNGTVVFSSEEDFFHGDGISGMMSARLSDDMYDFEQLLDDITVDENSSSINGAVKSGSIPEEANEGNGASETGMSGVEDRLFAEGLETGEFQIIGEASAKESDGTACTPEENCENEEQSADEDYEVQTSKNRTSLFRRVRLFGRVKNASGQAPSQKNDEVAPLPIDDGGETSDVVGNVVNSRKPFLRRLWRKRNARTIEEGIRREQTNKLSFLLNKALVTATPSQEKSYLERSLMGLVNGLAEEVEDLDIELNTMSKTPFWRKEVEEIRINFSRLGFRPIQIGGTNTIVEIIDQNEDASNSTQNKTSDGDVGQGPFSMDSDLPFVVDCADEGFDRIDEDGSGTLDADELAQALNSITGLKTDKSSIEELASDLVRLYDDNGDGVVDREEYKRMVDDMAKLRKAKEDGKNPFTAMKDSIQSVSEGISSKAGEVVSAARDKYFSEKNTEEQEETEMGSIVLSNVNLDLRRLVFGAFPVIKKITPGGPLILQPFTATVTASFSREDVMGSFLLDAALRRLVARALRVRVRSYRDLVEGAVFLGRQWKMESKTAPVVEVLGLSNVEFDSGDKMIVTGRAKIRADPDAPIVTSTFKLRTKIGTRKNGQVIKLKEPELAFVFECPKALERGLGAVCETFGLPPPKRPEPYYSFFPIYSPFKVDDDSGGFDMGEDNCIRSIFIRNGKLRFEMSVVLRPGRFLGNHYLAFTVPQRTFIITMDRVWNGIRAARENKQVVERAKKLKKAEDKSTKSNRAEDTNESVGESSISDGLPATPSDTNPRKRFFKAIKDNTPKPKSFYTRFVEGYTMLEREEEANNERISNDISDWFGRQGSSNNATSSEEE